MTLDRQLDALADQHRRRLLLSLEGQGPTGGPSVLDTQELDTDQRLLLRHVHLPKLQLAGYVDWDSETGRVGRGPQFEELRPLLQFLVDHEESFSGLESTD